jgi:tripartite-type tricarboxylate transporter receptor subunit TctC
MIGRILALSLALLTVSIAHAEDDVAAFYRGKQIRVVVGSAAGSGYDLIARLVWRYVANYIPGKPSVVIQNVPGAGSIVMANQVANTAPQDGTVVGAPINGMPTAPLLQPEATHFEPTKLLWIGAAARESQVAFAWHTAPVQSLEDLKNKALLVGATTAGTTMVDFPAVSNAFLGLKFDIVRGYEGTTQIFQAIEAGELQGIGGVGWSTVKLLAGKWLAQKQITVIAQYGFERIPALPDVPLVYDLAKTEEDRLALRLTFARQEYDRGYFLPPGVPAERVEILRRAFDAAMKDRDFRNEAQKLGVDIDPVPGDRIAALIAQVLATPRDVAERVRTIIAGP